MRLGDGASSACSIQHVVKPHASASARILLAHPQPGFSRAVRLHLGASPLASACSCRHLSTQHLAAPLAGVLAAASQFSAYIGVHWKELIISINSDYDCLKRLAFFNSRFLERRPESQAASSTRDLVPAGRCLIYRSSPWWHPLRSILCATEWRAAHGASRTSRKLDGGI